MKNHKSEHSNRYFGNHDQKENSDNAKNCHCDCENCRCNDQKCEQCHCNCDCDDCDCSEEFSETCCG